MSFMIVVLYYILFLVLLPFLLLLLAHSFDPGVLGRESRLQRSPTCPGIAVAVAT